MSPRRTTAAILLAGGLALGLGLTTFLVGTSKADDAAADLDRATEARGHTRGELVTSRQVDREIDDGLVDARLYATPLDPAVRRALDDSRAHRAHLQELLATIEQSVAAMRASDGPAYNGSVDRHNELVGRTEALWRLVDESTGQVSEHLAQVYAAFDDALLAGGR